MSGNSLERALNNTGAANVSQAPDDPPSSAEVVVLEEVAHDLVVGGVRPERAPELAQQVFSRVVSRVHIGPLPPVEDFAGYDEVCPGASREILDMAIAQQRHAHWIEKAEIIGEIALKVLGIFAALCVVGGLLAASVYCAIIGQTAVGVALASGAGIATIAGVFLRNFIRKPEPEPEPPKTKPKQKPKGKR